MRVKTKITEQLAQDIIEHNIAESISLNEIIEMAENRDPFIWDKLAAHDHTMLFDDEDECCEFCEEHADEIFASISDIMADKKIEIMSDVLSGFMLVGLWCDLVDWHDEDYDAAKQKLLSMGYDRPCLEEILAQALADGKSTYLHCEDGIMPLDQKTLLSALAKRSRGKTLDDILEDNEECDAVVQTALFGEVIYG